MQKIARIRVRPPKMKHVQPPLLLLDTYTFIQKLLNQRFLHHQKWLNREEPAISTFLNNPTSNLKITASICLKNGQNKYENSISKPAYTIITS